MTPQGQVADRIRKWAWQHPDRVGEAIDQVNELALQAEGPQALREIQDAGTMLARLKGSTMAPSISSQLQGS